MKVNSKVKLLIIAVVLTPFIFSILPFYTVDGGHRAIVLRFGDPVKTLGPGLHFKNPITESIIKVDIRTFKTESPANAGTKDLQTVNTAVAINYHLDPDKLIDTYSKFGLHLNHSVIAPRIQETVKSVIAKFSAEQLLTNRADVKSQIQSELATSLMKYNVILEGVQVTNFKFSKAFDDAIEQKQTAEQQALTAKNTLERVKYEAEQKIVQAQAEAQSIKIQSEAIRAQGGAAYVQLKAIEKWDGRLPNVNAGGAMPFLNINDFKQKTN